MAIHACDAIILRRYPFRETSLVLTLLSGEFGKFKGLVKGIRGPRSRFRGSMEPLTLNRVSFYDTRESQLHLISQGELIEDFRGLTDDLERMQTGAFCVELLDHVIPLEEAQPAVFRLFEDTLGQLASGSRAAEVLRAHFIARLLRLIGFNPQLHECVGCGKRIETAAHWSVQQGGLLDRNCLYMDPRAEAVDASMVEALAEFAEDHYPPRLDPQLLRMLRKRLDEFLVWRLDRPLRAHRR